jgi:UDP-2,4-diacetamido-2,4,6-trideoxy-beta-L-altropyranose hydrolase
LDGTDLAISGAGQSLLERLALGIPTLAIAVAENQRPALAGVVAEGAAVDLGDPCQESIETIAAQIAGIASCHDQRAALSHAALRLVDGRGAERVARRLAELSGNF